MIKIHHIQGVPQETDNLKVPENYVAKHSVGSEWIYFETIKEYEEYKGKYFPKNEEIIEE